MAETICSWCGCTQAPGAQGDEQDLYGMAFCLLNFQVRGLKCIIGAKECQQQTSPSRQTNKQTDKETATVSRFHEHHTEHV